jgi:hypothetical protein
LSVMSALEGFFEWVSGKLWRDRDIRHEDLLVDDGFGVFVVILQFDGCPLLKERTSFDVARVWDQFGSLRTVFAG